jgi:hypothetical protein
MGDKIRRDMKKSKSWHRDRQRAQKAVFIVLESKIATLENVEVMQTVPNRY